MKSRVRLLAALVAGVLMSSNVTVSTVTASPAAPAPAASPFVVNVESLSGGPGAAGRMDLTSYGDLDWVHVSGSGTERKAGVPAAISVESLGGAPDTLDRQPAQLRLVRRSRYGVVPRRHDRRSLPADGVSDHSPGSRLTAPAGVRGRRLAGTRHRHGRGHRRQRLRTRSRSPRDGTAAVKRYSVTIRPGEGIVVTGNLAEKLNPSGNLSLSAAALSRVGAFTATAPPVGMNLTAEGPDDWMHLDGSTINRRTGGNLAVANKRAGASIGAQNDNPVTYSWSNGVPTASQPGDPARRHLLRRRRSLERRPHRCLRLRPDDSGGHEPAVRALRLRCLAGDGDRSRSSSTAAVRRPP